MKHMITALLLITSPSWADAPVQSTVTLKADVWCPFNCEPDAKQPGYMVEIAKRAFTSINTAVDYQTMTWPRAIVEARDNKIDGIIGSAVTDSPDFIFPDQPLGVTKNCFYTRPDSKWTYTDINSLSEISIGIIKGYSYGKNVDDYFSKNENVSDTKKKTGKSSNTTTDKIQSVSGDAGLDLNYKKLQAKRIDAFIEEQNVLKNYIRTNKINENTLRPAGCEKEDKIYIAFGPNNPNAKTYAKLLSDTLDVMRKDGSLKKLLDQYGLQDWVK